MNVPVVAHRFLLYRPAPNASPLLGLVDDAQTTVRAVLNTKTGQAYSSLFSLVSDYPELSVDEKLALVPGSKRPLDKVEKLAPLPGRDVLCIGKNYKDHAREFQQSGFDSSDKNEQPSHPVIFTKRWTSIVPDGHPIYTHPNVTETLDYEGELGIIVGKPGRAIKKEDAWKHVWGAVIINDVTARERQRDHKQFYIGKSLDTFCPMGAFVVPSSSLPWSDLHLTTKVNGATRQSQNTSELIFDVPTLIETASMGITLQPGDVIATGTPYGVGMGMNPKTWLKDGDVVEVSIPPLGTLRSPISSTPLPAVSTLPSSTASAAAADSNLVRLPSGKALHVEVSGPADAPAVLFIHGLGGSLQFYKPAIDAAGLEQAQRVVLFDLEGHGVSPLASGELSVEGFADDAKAVLDLLGIKEASVVGHSMGGLVATTFAAKFPNVVKNLVLLGAVKQFAPAGQQALAGRAATVRAQGMTALADTIVKAGTSALTQSSNPLVKHAVRASVASSPVEGYARACEALAAAQEPAYECITAGRTVVVAGREDKTSPEATTAFLQEKIKGAEVVWLENVGHWHIFEDVEGVAKVFRDAL